MEQGDFTRYAKGFGHELLSPGQTAKTMVRAPLEAAVARRVAALPQRELADLVNAGSYTVSVAEPSTRHGWSLGAAEQIILQLLIKQRSVRSAFEIGTFNGGTTRLLAECLPEDGRVVTLDLPPERFDQTQHPDAFTGADVGAAFQDSPARDKITQELGDSLRFNFTPYRGQFDLVLVDGGHDYEHGFADTRSALSLVAPGGVIVWDDFEPYWHGLVNGILDAAGATPIGKLVGTSFAVCEGPAA